MLETRSSRRLSAGAALVFVCVGSVFALRSTVPPFAPQSPAFRQFGEADAPVTVVEFSDFQCPSCAYAVEPVKSLKKLYGSKMRFIFKHFPLMMHRRAKMAAVSADCAGRQGRFWELHDRLFSGQSAWSDDTLSDDQARAMIAGYAKEAKLDMAQYDACLRDPASLAAVEADEKEAKELFVRSTPTFFINGKRFIGGGQLRTAGALEIERILKK